MKRIAAHIGLTIFCALAVAFYLPKTVTLIVTASFGVLALLFLAIKKARRRIVLPLTAALIAVSCGINLAYTAMAVEPIVQKFCGESRKITATLTDEEYRQYAKTYYRLKTESIDGEEVHVRILLKTDRPLEIEPFDTVSFTADIIPTESNYYLAKGYYISVNVPDIGFETVKCDTKPLYYRIIQLRQAMRDVFDRYLPEAESSLCNAVLLGDKYALDQTVKDDFRYSGASYLIVVSGMHFAVICSLSYMLFKKLLRKRYLYFPLTYLVIILYMMITGFQPPVMRSGIMMLILITGRLVRRQSDSLTSLGIAGLLMPVIFSPYGCGDIGMILSFAATFSIIVWEPAIYSKLRIKKVCRRRITRWTIKGINFIISIFCVSLAANILVFPLSVILFNGFSLMTLVSGVVLYPLILLVMVLSLFVCVFCYLGPLKYCSLLLLWPLYGIAKLILLLVSGLSSLPFAYIHVKSIYFYIWTAVTLSLGLLAYGLRRRCRLYPYVILLSAIVFFGGLTVNTAVLLNTNLFEYYAGKDGAVVYLNYCGRIHMLRFDCDSETVYQTMYRLEDDYGGVQSAVCTGYRERVNYNRMSDREFSVAHYLMYRNVTKYYGDDEAEDIFGGNTTYYLDDGVVLKTVENNGKVLLYLTDADHSILLIPSGFELDAIPNGLRSADIILMDRAGERYDRLKCSTLILCSSLPQKEKLPQYDSLVKPSERHIEINLN